MDFSLTTLVIYFIALIIALAALRSRLVYELSGTSLLLFGSTKPGINFYSLIFLPGTIIHELSHWVVAEVLQVRTGEITIFPDLSRIEDTYRLGSVATVKSDPFRGFLIGVAPFFSGLIICLVLGHFLQIGWGTYSWWTLSLIIYGIIVISNSMLISKEDRRTWPFIIVFLTLIFTLISKYYPSLFIAHNSSFIKIFSSLNNILGVTAGLNLVMIVGLYSLRRVVEKIIKRRIL